MIHTRTIDYSAQPLPAAWYATGNPAPVETDESPATGLRLAGPSGELRTAIAHTIDMAREVVLLSAFLFSDREIEAALIRAASRGVRVYILTASSVRLEKLLRDEADFDRKMAAEHAALLKRLAPHALVRTADRFHAKFLIADPAFDTAAGWVSTANFNPAMMRNLEIACAISPAAISTLAAAFHRAFWCESSHELCDDTRLATVGAPPAIPTMPAGDLAWANLKDSPELTEACVRLIDAAQTRVDLCAFSIEKNHPVSEAIMRTTRRGVPVRLFLRPGPTGEASLRELFDAGIEIIGDDRLHAKAILADRAALVMTGNPTHAEAPAFDIGVLCDDAQRVALQSLFDRWAETFPWRFRPHATLGDHLGELRSPDGRETHTVAENATRDLGAHKAPPALPEKSSGPKYARQIEYRWEIASPPDKIAKPPAKPALPQKRFGKSAPPAANTPPPRTTSGGSFGNNPFGGNAFGSLGDKFGKK